MALQGPRLGQLVDCYDLEEAVWNARGEDDICTGFRFVECEVMAADCCGVTFEGCVFDHCKLSQCGFEGCDFTDVRFDRCDLSNAVFRKAVFFRNEWRGTKAIGCDLQESRWMQVLLEECVLRYGNLSRGKLRNVRFDRCMMQEAALNRCRLQMAEFSRCDLTRANVTETPLAGMDLSDSILDGLLLSEGGPELRGLSVSYDQAAELARLLGLNIK